MKGMGDELAESPAPARPVLADEEWDAGIQTKSVIKKLLDSRDAGSATRRIAEHGHRSR